MLLCYKMCNMNKKFLSTTELAELIGISRISVYRKIKKGDIKATKVGRNFVIKKSDLGGILDDKLTPERKKEIDEVVDRVVKEYGKTLEMLSRI